MYRYIKVCHSLMLGHILSYAERIKSYLGLSMLVRKTVKLMRPWNNGQIINTCMCIAKG